MTFSSNGISFAIHNAEIIDKIKKVHGAYLTAFPYLLVSFSLKAISPASINAYVTKLAKAHILAAYSKSNTKAAREIGIITSQDPFTGTFVIGSSS